MNIWESRYSYVMLLPEIGLVTRSLSVYSQGKPSWETKDDIRRWVLEQAVLALYLYGPQRVWLTRR
jgi:hypothetical protein